MKRKAAIAAIRRLNNIPEEDSDYVEEGNGDNVSNAGSDCEEILQHHDSDCSTSSSDDETNIDLRPLRERVTLIEDDGDVYQARNGTTWEVYNTNSSTAGRCSSQNIMRVQPGPTSYATSRISTGSPLSAWKLLIDEPMVRHICRCTNEEASRQRSSEEWKVSPTDLETVFGLMYAKGLFLSSKTPMRLLWSTKWSMPLFSAMSRDRFYEIMRYMRFDEKPTRSERLQRDKFALASDLWTPFVDNCVKCFNPYENLTIDEQLVPCKTRCRFIQYMANKPDKFGLKFFLAVDLKQKYVCNGLPYLGKYDDRPEDESLSCHVV